MDTFRTPASMDTQGGVFRKAQKDDWKMLKKHIIACYPICDKRANLPHIRQSDNYNAQVDISKGRN